MSRARPYGVVLTKNSLNPKNAFLDPPPILTPPLRGRPSEPPPSPPTPILGINRSKPLKPCQMPVSSGLLGFSWITPPLPKERPAWSKIGVPPTGYFDGKSVLGFLVIFRPFFEGLFFPLLQIVYFYNLLLLISTINLNYLTLNSCFYLFTCSKNPR